MVNNSVDMYSVDEFATKAGITTAHTRQLLREGKIKAIKVGKEWRVNKEEANKYLGIKTDMSIVEKELIISELQGKLKITENKLETFKNLIGVLANMAGI